MLLMPYLSCLYTRGVKVELLRKLIKTDDPELDAENDEVRYTATCMCMCVRMVIV